MIYYQFFSYDSFTYDYICKAACEDSSYFKRFFKRIIPTKFHSIKSKSTYLLKFLNLLKR